MCGSETIRCGVNYRVWSETIRCGVTLSGWSETIRFVEWRLSRHVGVSYQVLY